MGWLWLVGSLKIYVSFAEYRLFSRALLQKRRVCDSWISHASRVTHDLFIHVRRVAQAYTRAISRDVTHPCMCNVIHAHMCDMTHQYVCNMKSSNVWHDNYCVQSHVKHSQLQIGWDRILRLFLKTFNSTRRIRILMGLMISTMLLAGTNRETHGQNSSTLTKF